jgi:hypothetical protein
VNTNVVPPTWMAIAIATITLTHTTSVQRAQTAAPVIAAKSITRIPYVIKKPGLYILKKDLVLADANSTAILIDASDVTIDLGGRVLSSGAAQDSTNASYGIRTVSYAANITPRNGTLRNFHQGASIYNGGFLGRILVENMTAANN